MTNDVDVEGHDLLVLKKLGTLCHNRRATKKEVGEAFDAHPRRAKGWLKAL